MFKNKRLPEPSWLKALRNERDDIDISYESCSDAEDVIKVSEKDVPDKEPIVYKNGEISQLDMRPCGRKARDLLNKKE